MQSADHVEGQPQADLGIINPKDPFETGFLVDLPVNIVIERISMVSDVKTVWRDGIRSIEQMFADHISRMNDAFEVKALENEKVGGGPVTNSQFPKRFYLAMQRERNARYMDLWGARAQ